MLASWPVWTRRAVTWRDVALIVASCSGMWKAGIAGCIRRSLLSLLAQMLGIMAGMHQKDCYKVGFAGDDAHHVSVQALVLGSGTAFRVASDKDVDMPVVCSTDARYRRAENFGAPQLQFVDQVELSLFGNTGAGPKGSCPQGRDPRN